MQDEIDFEQLIELLDGALTSKNPKVLQALKKFLFIAALSLDDRDENDENYEPGPFRQLLDKVVELERRVGQLEHPYTNIDSSPWTTQPGTGCWPTPGGGHWGQGTSISIPTIWVSTQPGSPTSGSLTGAGSSAQTSGPTGTVMGTSTSDPSANFVSYGSTLFDQPKYDLFSNSATDSLIDAALADLDRMAEDK